MTFFWSNVSEDPRLAQKGGVIYYFFRILKTMQGCPSGQIYLAKKNGRKSRDTVPLSIFQLQCGRKVAVTKNVVAVKGPQVAVVLG